MSGEQEIARSILSRKKIGERCAENEQIMRGLLRDIG